MRVYYNDMMQDQFFIPIYTKPLSEELNEELEFRGLGPQETIVDCFFELLLGSEVLPIIPC